MINGPELADAASFFTGKKIELPEEVDEVIEVFEENYDAFLIFCQMTTQWVVGGMGSAIGISYPSLDTVMKLNRIKDRLDCFRRIRVLERRALEHMQTEVKSGSTTKV